MVIPSASPRPGVFGLVLMVDHACNLRCTYCYTGAKAQRAMPEAVGRHAIDRALATLPRGGTLELGFFGGEPLLQPRLVSTLIDHARTGSDRAGVELRVGLTTNGTQAGPDAWPILSDPDVDVAISHDGLPSAHDRHRLSADGRGTATQVLATMDRLRACGREVKVVTVVRPDTLDGLPDGLAFHRERGVRQVDLSLDLWTAWTEADGSRLESALAAAAEVWRESFPHFGVSWFDEKAARLAGLPFTETARCGFGVSEVAVAPSGRLYPCERVIGEDPPEHPLRLAGHALEGGDFLDLVAKGSHGLAEDLPDACAACRMQPICGTTCRCSNYVRTGSVSRPDGLLCLLEQACVREAARALTRLAGEMPTATA